MYPSYYGGWAPGVAFTREWLPSGRVSPQSSLLTLLEQQQFAASSGRASVANLSGVRACGRLLASSVPHLWLRLTRWHLPGNQRAQRLRGRSAQASAPVSLQLSPECLPSRRIKTTSRVLTAPSGLAS